MTVTCLRLRQSVRERGIYPGSFVCSPPPVTFRPHTTALILQIEFTSIANMDTDMTDAGGDFDIILDDEGIDYNAPQPQQPDTTLVRFAHRALWAPTIANDLL